MYNTIDAGATGVESGIYYDVDMYNGVCLGNLITNFDSIGKFGIVIDAGEYQTSSFFGYNAFYNNNTNTSNYTGVDDVILSENPYTTAGSDWSLNNVTGGGADCRNAGFNKVGLIDSPILG